jgi:lipopolysaccharide transport system ATP-binding protein
MGDIAIRVEHLSKLYRIGPREPYKALRDTLTAAMYAPFRAVSAFLSGRRSAVQNSPSNSYVWALKDVSFEVKRGEVVGIIGRNGAGKTTLLKILSRVTEPTEGYAEIHGRVGSLLEVGTGFHPELTGRENIYLSGIILGMKKAEIDRKFDEIVAFAGIEKFLDTPVKYYSSGMYVRLAFAVAAHLEPEILLVDEVLAVGDAAFQKKCLGKMGEVAKEGRTVLFVSHNMGAIRGLCKRGLWIDSGQIVMDGDTERVVASYLNRIFEKGFEIQTHGSVSDDQLQIRKVVFKNSKGEPSMEFAPGDELVIEIHYHAPRRFNRPYFWIGIVSQYGPLFGASMLFDGHRPDYVEGEGILSCKFKSLPLVPQTYTVRIGVRAQDGVTLLAPTQEVGFFNVIGKMSDYGFQGELAEILSWDSSPIILPYEWHFPDGQIISVDGFGSRGYRL